MGCLIDDQDRLIYTFKLQSPGGKLLKVIPLTIIWPFLFPGEELIMSLIIGFMTVGLLVALIYLIRCIVRYAQRDHKLIIDRSKLTVELEFNGKTKIAQFTSFQKILLIWETHFWPYQAYLVGEGHDPVNLVLTSDFLKKQKLNMKPIADYLSIPIVEDNDFSFWELRDKLWDWPDE